MINNTNTNIAMTFANLYTNTIAKATLECPNGYSWGCDVDLHYDKDDNEIIDIELVLYNDNKKIGEYDISRINYNVYECEWCIYEEGFEEIVKEVNKAFPNFEREMHLLAEYANGAIEPIMQGYEDLLEGVAFLHKDDEIYDFYKKIK